jgi:hypothetical protein
VSVSAASTTAEPEVRHSIADLPGVLRDNEYDRELVAHVRPSDWVNPAPGGRYNLVVLGAGTAGLVTAAGAAGLGARVALIERRLCAVEGPTSRSSLGA